MNYEYIGCHARSSSGPIDLTASWIRNNHLVINGDHFRFKKISWCFSFFGSRNFYNENDIFMTWSIQKLYFDPKFKSFLTEFWLGAFQGQVNIYSYWKTLFYTWVWCKYFDHWRSSKFRSCSPEIFRFFKTDVILSLPVRIPSFPIEIL